ncbi:2'-5' RNA ligase family protein [Polaromonas sp. P5_D5]
MSGQSALPGFDDTPAPTDRLFFALFPDAETAERIAQCARQLRTEHGLHGAPLKTGRFHITLHHLGDYAGLPQGVVDMAGQAAAAVKSQPFSVTFDRAASFSSSPRNRPFVLRGDAGLADLMAFQRALGIEMTKAGLGRWAKPAYTPHVTLLYDDRAVAEQVVEPITWTAGEFILVRSLIGQTLHVPLARWPLRP